MKKNNLQSKVKIIADSTCDLPENIVDRYDIGIINLSISIDGKSYLENIEITSDELFQKLPDLEDLPTTSMPSPEAFIAEIEVSIVEGYDEILLIIQSSGTSGSYQSAVLAKEIYFERNPESNVNIHVVDSLSMSHGSGWLVMKSARLREIGYTFHELVHFNETKSRKVKHLLSVVDLNNLIKSGRLTNGSAIIGKLLRIQPIMTMKDSRGVIVAKIRGRKTAMKYYIDEFLERVDDTLTDFVIIGYSSDISLAKSLKKSLKEVLDKEIMIIQMGPAVGTHVGLGGVSMFFMEK